jgi:hypothetical protein
MTTSLVSTDVRRSALGVRRSAFGARRSGVVSLPIPIFLPVPSLLSVQRFRVQRFRVQRFRVLTSDF